MADAPPTQLTQHLASLERRYRCWLKMTAGAVVRCAFNRPRTIGVDAESLS